MFFEFLFSSSGPVSLARSSSAALNRGGEAVSLSCVAHRARASSLNTQGGGVCYEILTCVEKVSVNTR